MKSHEDVNNGTRRDDMERRDAIVQQIIKKLSTYNDFIFQQAKLRQFDPVPKRDIADLKNWHWNHDNMAIAEEEQKYLDFDDLICPVPAGDETPLRRLLDKSLWLRTLAMRRNKDDKAPDDDKQQISYYANKHMNLFTSLVLLTSGLLMLITPMWILQALNGIRHKLAVITAYVFAFLLILSFAMYTKLLETLGATDAYAAVLMVFVQVGEQW